MLPEARRDAAYSPRRFRQFWGDILHFQIAVLWMLSLVVSIGMVVEALNGLGTMAARAANWGSVSMSGAR